MYSEHNATSQATLQLECQQGANAKAELLHKWDTIASFQEQNAAMDDLIKLLFKENILNKQQWEAAAADTKQYLSEQLIPAMGQVCKETRAMHDGMKREQAAFAQVELQQLPTYCAHGEVVCDSLYLDYACNAMHAEVKDMNTVHSTCQAQILAELHVAAFLCDREFAGRISFPMQRQTLLYWRKALQDTALRATAPAQASQADDLLSILQEASR